MNNITYHNLGILHIICQDINKKGSYIQVQDNIIQLRDRIDKTKKIKAAIFLVVATVLRVTGIMDAVEGIYSIFYFVSAGVKILMATVIGVLMTKSLRKIAKKGKWLVKNGLKLTGTVENIQPIGQPYPDGQYDYNVYCTYTDISTSMTDRFKSKVISSLQVSCIYKDMPIEVYVNPKDYGQYYINTEHGQLKIQ